MKERKDTNDTLDRLFRAINSDRVFLNEFEMNSLKQTAQPHHIKRLQHNLRPLKQMLAYSTEETRGTFVNQSGKEVLDPSHFFQKIVRTRMDKNNLADWNGLFKAISEFRKDLALASGQTTETYVDEKGITRPKTLNVVFYEQNPK